MTEDDITPQLGRLTVADLEFVIHSAVIAENTDAEGHRCWDLQIDTVERRIEYPPGEFFCWGPSLRGESVRVQAPPLASIIGHTIIVPEAYDKVRGVHLFWMYVFEHEGVSNSRICFLEEHGDALRLEWRGKCNIYFDSTYGESVPFALLADVQIRNA